MKLESSADCGWKHARQQEVRGSDRQNRTNSIQDIIILLIPVCVLAVLSCGEGELRLDPEILECEFQENGECPSEEEDLHNGRQGEGDSPGEWTNGDDGYSGDNNGAGNGDVDDNGEDAGGNGGGDNNGGSTSDPCDGVICGENASCVDGQCLCVPGFSLQAGECVPDDPCEGVVCGPNAYCQEGHCYCESGFHMDNGSCVEDDPCEGLFCGSNAYCVDGLCVCDTAYEGDPYTGCTPVHSIEQVVRQRLVEVASDEVGSCERGNEDDKVYMTGQPGYWCYDFVAWVYNQVRSEISGVFLQSPIHLPRYYAPDFNGDSQWRPKAGDLIKYTYQHFAMVEEVVGDDVYTIEGNVNGCVMKRGVSYSSIEYYGVLEQSF